MVFEVLFRVERMKVSILQILKVEEKSSASLDLYPLYTEHKLFMTCNIKSRGLQIFYFTKQLYMCKSDHMLEKIHHKCQITSWATSGISIDSYKSQSAVILI